MTKFRTKLQGALSKIIHLPSEAAPCSCWSTLAPSKQHRSPFSPLSVLFQHFFPLQRFRSAGKLISVYPTNLSIRTTRSEILSNVKFDLWQQQRQQRQMTADVKKWCWSFSEILNFKTLEILRQQRFFLQTNKLGETQLTLKTSTFDLNLKRPRPQL